MNKDNKDVAPEKIPKFNRRSPTFNPNSRVPAEGRQAVEKLRKNVNVIYEWTSALP